MKHIFKINTGYYVHWRVVLITTNTNNLEGLLCVWEFGFKRLLTALRWYSSSTYLCHKGLHKFSEDIRTWICWPYRGTWHHSDTECSHIRQCLGWIISKTTDIRHCLKYRKCHPKVSKKSRFKILNLKWFCFWGNLFRYVQLRII